MWARVVEFMLGCWLAMSPFVFQHAPDETLFWTTDFVAAALVTTLAVLSYWQPIRHAHLALILVAIVLIAIGRFATGSPVPAVGQSYLVVGLLLLTFAIVPNNASQPPVSKQTS